MKFAHFLKALLLGVLIVLSASCEKAPEGGVLSPDDVTITLDVDKLSLSSANIRVRHDGSADLNWVYLLTSDLTTDADQLIDADVAKSLQLTGEILANKGQNKSILMPDLSPKSYYRFICKVIDSLTGETIGKAAQIEFRTRRDPDLFELNSNWEIEVGSRTINQTDKMEYDNFICSSTDEEYYVLLPISVTDFAFYYKSEIKKLFEDYVSSFGLEEGDAKWKNIVKSGGSSWAEQRLRSGDWKIFMIGIDQQGELTGLYQELDHEIIPETMTPEYEKWLGNWMVTDKDGKNLFKITFIPSENNMWYYMGGWESGNILFLDTFDPNLMPEVFFDKETGNIVFVSQYVNTLVDVDEWNFYFSGTFTYGSSYVLGDQVLNYRMAEADFNDVTGSARIEPLKFVTGGAEFMIESICYIYYMGSQLGSISMDPPTLPLTMTRIAAE